MNAARRIATILGLLAVVGAGLAAVGGAFGWAHGWLDGFNHFGIVWAAAAITGAALVWWARPRDRRLRPVFACALVSVAVTLAPIGWEVLRPGDRLVPAPPDAPTLKVLTFNLFWEHTAQSAAAAIRASNADVVALQQVYPHARTLVGLRDLYPRQFACGPGCSTAILSKRPILATGRAPAPSSGRHALIWARTLGPNGRPFTIAATHLGWPVPGVQDPANLALARTLSGFDADTVLAGDFNITPWSYALRRLDADLAPLSRRTRGLLSWPAGRGLPPFAAIDQVYAGPAWKTVSVRRLPAAASDHYPVLVELSR